ncbi:MAG: Fic family protein, partial [Thermoplasmata archaeon]|nr:Fic family protein [Thermoplasmata archaeon]
FLHQTVQGLLTSSELESYEWEFEIAYVHGTTYIEGNTLTIREARNLLTHGITPKGKSLREIFEVQNYKKVLLYRNSYKGKVTIEFIKELHSIIVDNIDLESAGLFRRTDDFGIVGYDRTLCPASLIEEELDEAIRDFYSGLKEGKHPFELAVVFHHRFESIHPFADGNGRVGREVLNHMLVRHRFPRILILPKDRERYLDALKHGDEESASEMVKIFCNLLIEQRYDILENNLKSLVGKPKG